ncbi:magnesium transport protein CorA [Bacteroidia bacterium]|nr:magnesium transport protein CorA [Bacteroidia bacterium]GHT72746.1 magnesium transport protein CorA [Bacteroidia bacterium]
MVNFYIKGDNQKIVNSSNLQQLEELGYDDVIWIDMVSPDEAERETVEQYLNINLHNRQRAEEIESSSRYYEDENALYANATFVTQAAEGTLQVEQVSFVLSEGVLVSSRPLGLRAFSETTRKLYINSRLYPTCFHVIVSILESRIDIDADLLELLAKEVSTLNKISAGEGTMQPDKKLLLTINRLQESTMVMRESIVEKQRLVSSFLKSDHFPSDTMPKLAIMIKDVGSLISYADFTFERLEFLQNTVMGLISLDQNKVIKIFTVATLIFMPPTLIGSIYGMNFANMPELSWTYGYPFAMGLMLLSVAVTLLIFRFRKLL